MLAMFMDCQFLIVPSVFSNVHAYQNLKEEYHIKTSQ